MLGFLLLKPFWLGKSHSPNFWLLLYMSYGLFLRLKRKEYRFYHKKRPFVMYGP